MMYMAILRSPYGHARITRIDTTAGASRHPGVHAVFTGKDIEGKVNPMPCAWLIPDSDLKMPDYPALATDTVRFTGDGVAAVVADDPYIAHDALDLIEVDYDPLPVGHRRRSRRWPRARRNCTRARRTIRPSTGSSPMATLAAALRDAEVDHQAALHPAAARAQRDGAARRRRHVEPRHGRADRLQHSARTRTSRASCSAVTTGIPENKIRVISRDVGGGFGSKIPFYPGDALTIFAVARARAARSNGSRTAARTIVATIHGRDADHRRGDGARSATARSPA